MLAGRTAATALQALLVAAATAAGPRWYLGRGWPVAELPAGKLVLGDEDLDAGADADITWPRVQAHTLTVLVECMADATADPEGAADALAEQVLQAVGATVQPLEHITVLPQRLARRLSTEGQARVAITTVTLQMLFSTRSNAPATLL